LVPTPLVSRQAAVSGRRGDIQMAGAAALERKTKVLNEVRSKMDGASLMFCVRSEGIRVNEINALRQTLPDGVEFKCVKNTLVNLAAKEYENFNADNIDTLLHYSNYWFFVQEEKMRESVELWNDWIKKGKKDNVIVGGVFGAQVLDREGIEAVSKLPTKQELMGKTATLLKCLPAKLARGLKGAGAERLARGVKEARGSKMARAIKLASEKLPQ